MGPKYIPQYSEQREAEGGLTTKEVENFMNEQEDGVMAGRAPAKERRRPQRGRETDSLLDPPEGGSLANTLTVAERNPILDSWTP